MLIHLGDTWISVYINIIVGRLGLSTSIAHADCSSTYCEF